MNVSANTGRLLKGLVAIAMVCATAQVFGASIREDTFESYSDQYEITNATTWAAGGNDMSIVVASNYTYTAATMPLSASAPSTAHTKVLQLNTEGDQLTNDVSTADALTESGPGTVYIDQMVFLVPSDDQPDLSGDDSIQMAVYLDSNSNLVVYSADNSAVSSLNSFTTVSNVTVYPETWVRLTVTMDYVSGYDDVVTFSTVDWFTVEVDGTLLTSPEAYSSPMKANLLGDDANDGGSWFVAANATAANQSQLAGISYQGTGMIDDLVVTAVEPTFEEGTPVEFFTIASVVGANGSIDPVGDITIASGTSTQIVFSADTYYEIESLEVDGVAVTDAPGEITYTYTYTAVSADVSNNVAFAVITSASGAPATWYGPLSIDPGVDGEDGDGDGYTLGQEYVAGMDPTVQADFEITSFSIDGSGFLTVTWDGADSPAVATTLSAMGADAVGDTPAAIAGTATFSGGVWTWVSTAAVPDTTKFIYLSAAE